MCMVSLIISAAGIPSVRTDTLAVVLPGPWKIFFIRLNIYIAAVIAIHVVLSPPGSSWDFNGGEGLWMDDMKHLGLLPLGMCSSWGFRYPMTDSSANNSYGSYLTLCSSVYGSCEHDGTGTYTVLVPAT